MIFSHAPAGFLVTYATKKIWDKNLTKRQTLWIFIIGTFSAILPDFDVLYFYLFKADSTHRELFTHSFFIYLVIALIIFLVGFLLKKQFIKSISIVFFFSILSHLLLDSLTAGVLWLYPFNNYLYGLLSISCMNDGFYGQNLFVFTLSVEVLMFVLLFNLIAHIKSKSKKFKISFSILSAIFFIAWVVLLFAASKSMYIRNSDYYFNDLDGDGIINMRDADMDGDGEENILDLDANNNNSNNINDIINESNLMVGSWYDWTEKGYWGLLSRFGTLSNTDVVLKAYDSAGIYLGSEIKKDFQNNSEMYYGNPDDHMFQNNPNNLYVFCAKNGYILEEGNEPEKGDIVFYGERDVSHVSLFFENTDSFLVLDGGTFSKIDIVNNDTVEDKFGEVQDYCRILNK